MSLANDTIVVTPGSGATVATHSPGGSNTTEYQVTMLADATGHLYETKPTYVLSIPKINAAANAYPWEVFNGSASTATMTIFDIRPIVNTDNAVAGVVGIRYDFYRTTAKASGGTLATYESSIGTITPNFARFDTNDSVVSSAISAAATLTSITTGSYLFTSFAYAEETSAAANLLQAFNVLPNRPFTKGLVLRPGQGLATRQGTIASVGTVGWTIFFTLDP